MNLISVIVPVYNVEKYIVRCLDSLVNQTYPDIEIILVDDGSSDNSGEICKQYAKSFSQVRYYKKKNGGLSDARNYGIGKAQGDYIAFVDSDDWVNTDIYKTLYESIKTYNAEISACGFAIVTDEDSVGHTALTSIKTEIFDQKDAIEQLFGNDKYANFAWNKLYKKDLFKDVKYPVGKYMEDLGTTYRLFMKARTITYKDNKLYYYYQREGSILHTKSRQLYQDKLELSLQRFKILKGLYPKMEKNYTYYLDCLIECFPFLDIESTLYSEAVKTIKEIKGKYYMQLSLSRRIKYGLLKLSPRMFLMLFKNNGKANGE